MPKPSDLFLGAMEFLGIVVPGALLVWTLLPWLEGAAAAFGLAPEGAVPRGAAFALLAYVAGQALHGLGGKLLDPIYDRWWLPAADPAHWRAARLLAAGTFPPPPTVVGRAGDAGKAVGRNILGLLGVPPKRGARAPMALEPLRRALADDPDCRDTLLARAFVASSGVRFGDNLFHLCWSRLRIEAPGAAAEVDRASADGKMFRALALVLPLIALRLVAEHLAAGPAVCGAAPALCSPILPWLAAAALLAVALLCARRAFKHRRDASHRCYEFVLVLEDARRRKRDDAAAVARAKADPQ